jgi:molybdopterin adenylyltransferase
MFPDKIRFAVITLSDRASRGEYEDLSGPVIAARIRKYFSGKSVEVEIEPVLIPDDPQQLTSLIAYYHLKQTDVVFTTGGTGIGPRDLTPDIIKPLLDKEVPGIMEMIRVKYGMNHPAALLSRSIAGIIDKTLVYCLPGSVKAVVEYCDEIIPTILHSMRMLHDVDEHND